PRDFLASAIGPDGRVYAIAGSGEDPDPAVTEVDAYDTGTGTWTQVASLPGPLADFPAALATDGRIYTFGGIHVTTHKLVPVVYSYDALGPATASASGPVNLTTAFSAYGVRLTPTQGQTFNGTVASLLNVAPGTPTTAFTVTILWGDNTTSAGTVVE